jgi:hypothetical protein
MQTGFVMVKLTLTATGREIRKPKVIARPMGSVMVRLMPRATGRATWRATGRGFWRAKQRRMEIYQQ